MSHDWKRERILTELENYVKGLKHLLDFTKQIEVDVNTTKVLENSDIYSTIDKLISRNISLRTQMETNLLRISHLLGWSKPLPLFGDTPNKIPQVFITLDQSSTMHITDQITFNPPVIRGDYTGEVIFVFVDPKEKKAYTTVREIVSNYIDHQKDGTETQTLIVPAVCS